LATPIEERRETTLADGVSIRGKQPVPTVAYDGSTSLLVPYNEPVRKTMRYLREDAMMRFGISTRLLIRKSEVCEPSGEEV
jgi:hypothetical protein